MFDISQLTNAKLDTLVHGFLLMRCVFTVTLFPAAGNSKGTTNHHKSRASFAWMSPTSCSTQLYVLRVPPVGSTTESDPSYTSVTAAWWRDASRSFHTLMLTELLPCLWLCLERVHLLSLL